jgi:hypothetical protein
MLMGSIKSIVTGMRMILKSDNLLGRFIQ